MFGWWAKSLGSRRDVWMGRLDVDWVDGFACQRPALWQMAAVGEEDVGADWMDSKPTTCLMADGLQSISV